jgi:hypothetical protein
MPEATGLMAFWARIGDDYVARFRAWHNCEHIPERVSVPGFRTGRRYCSLTDPRVFLMMYDTDDAAVLSSESYRRCLDAPTPWTRESLGHFRDPVRGVYSLMGESGPAPSLNDAPYLLAARFDLVAEDPAAVLGGRLDELRAALAGGPPGRARLFGSDDAAAGLATSERGIHGGGPGEERYLLLLETGDPEPLARLSGIDWLGGEVVGMRDTYGIDYALNEAGATS